MSEIKLLGKKPTRHGFGEGLVVLGEKYDNVNLYFDLSIFS